MYEMELPASCRDRGRASQAWAMKDDKDAARQEVLAALAEQLDEMTLHDETGDPSDEGYMNAVRELRDWLTDQSA